MPDEARVVAGFALPLLTAFFATPVAIAVANRTDFLDRPVGYKGHGRATPYLGGAAVILGVLAAACLVVGSSSRLAAIIGALVALWAVGTADDRFTVKPGVRVLAEVAAAALLWQVGVAFTPFDSDVLNFAVSAFWIVAVVNAFNLMDNMDGAASTVALVSGAGIGVAALVEGDVTLAVLAFGLAGALAGFLPYNLAKPARIFLGDGGSMPVGFLVGALSMGVVGADDPAPVTLVTAVLLAGLPLVDTALVLVSRRRRGVSFLVGGQDHMTHRLRKRLRTPREVALSLAAIQGTLCLVAIAAQELGEGSVVVAGAMWFVMAAGMITLLESRAWAPDEPPAQPVPDGPPEVDPPPGARRFRLPFLGPRATGVELVTVTVLGLACGLSPFFYGLYDLSTWGPLGLLMLAILVGLVVARPAHPRPIALVALAALVGLWVWSLASTGWAEAADQALDEANRWLLYGAMFALLVLVLRDDRLGQLLVGVATLMVLVFAGYICVRLVTNSGPSLFLYNRLNEPLGYVNGQAGYLLLGFWPLVALAERARRPETAAAATAAAVLVGGHVLLSQTRAVFPALVVGVVVMLAVVPGRMRRLGVLGVVAFGILVAAVPVLDVYRSAQNAGLTAPGVGSLRDAVLALIFGAVAAAAAWLALAEGARRWVRDGRLALGSARAVPLRQIAVASIVAAAVVGSAALVAATGNPFDEARDQYNAFANLREEQGEPGARSRFASGGGYRFDYWRIAANEFADAPLRGVGAGNYDQRYFIERATRENIQQPHSMPMQLLAELGLVGGVLLLIFVGAVLTGFARRARRARTDPREIGLTVAAGGVFITWLAHTSVDWLHLIPGITGFALFAAAALLGGWTPEPRRGQSVRRRLVSVAALVAIVAAAVVLGRATMADRYLGQAEDASGTEPARVLDRVEKSLELNDEALEAYYLRSSAHAQLGNYRAARAALLEAIRREPHDFVPYALLGDLAIRRGDFETATRYYRRASDLNPRDEVLADLAGNPVLALPDMLQ